ncbi:MAG: two-component system, OmpR family, copper resistance phosphate regulon response regulator CusR [Thermoleophilaceae bacterium]|jgi:DNA-binding response OmpR family regulator|nr:two-component system, OmpR family, copper resistance phosphate regulon response regulator CusR [Thermoleophilaceae bacterium]
MQILVVEDEARISTFVARALRAEGMRVGAAKDGQAGLARALAHSYDLVILDLMLPALDGLEVMRELHARKPDLPVLILSARSDLETKLRGFELGADDYLAKPFSLDELLARVRVHLRRRVRGDEDDVLRAGALVLDEARREARIGEHVSKLTDGEFRLLHELAAHAGEVISRERVLADVWGYDFDPRSNVVDVAIRRLRQKLGPDAPIETVRNVGYRLTAA